MTHGKCDNAHYVRSEVLLVTSRPIKLYRTLRPLSFLRLRAILWLEGIFQAKPRSPDRSSSDLKLLIKIFPERLSRLDAVAGPSDEVIEAFAHLFLREAAMRSTVKALEGFRGRHQRLGRRCREGEGQSRPSLLRERF